MAHAGFSPEDSLLATGSFDGSCKLWSTKTTYMQRELKGHSAPVCTVAFCPTARVLASGGSDELVMLWSVPDGRFLFCWCCLFR